MKLVGHTLQNCNLILYCAQSPFFIVSKNPISFFLSLLSFLHKPYSPIFYSLLVGELAFKYRELSNQLTFFFK